MKKLAFLITIVAILFQSCTSEKTRSEEKAVADEPSQPVPKKSETEVKEFLKESGVLIEVNGKEVYREDNLKDVSYQDLIESLKSLEANNSGNNLAIFYLKVAGAAREDQSERARFIKDYVSSDEEFYKPMDKMVKFLQRQERPMIKAALLNITEEISNDQCLEYLQYSGYISGTAASSFSYNDKVLKTYPMFFKIALLDKLRNAEGKAGMVYEQMAASLGVS